jgi:hypothetical protein
MCVFLEFYSLSEFGGGESNSHPIFLRVLLKTLVVHKGPTRYYFETGSLDNGTPLIGGLEIGYKQCFFNTICDIQFFI